VTAVDQSSSYRTSTASAHRPPTHSSARPADDLPRGRHATPWGQGFPRTVGWTILGTFIPGAGLIAAGRRRLGTFVLGSVATGLLILVGIVLFTDPISLLTSLASSPKKLLFLAAGFGVLLLSWALVIIVTHTATRRFAVLTNGQRVLATLLVASLIGVVALPTARAGSDVLIAHNLLKSIFGAGGLSGANGPDSSQADPWAGTTRINVLLLGVDSGDDRIGLRPDTLIVASINTQTGDTVLVSLPRNLQHVPFPDGSAQAADYPNGFYCYNAEVGTNTECLINSLWTWGESNKDRYYSNTENAGLTATVEGVQEVTGLNIDQYVMLNIEGLVQFINAIGGLTLNVKERLPVGGSTEHPYATSWIETGTQKLDGYNSMWFARSRWSTSDYDRMRRQRCVIAAVTEQSDPMTLAIAFPEIAAAMKTNLQTSIPSTDINAWAELSQRVKGAQIRSLTFTDALINTGDPDVDEMRRMVSESLDPPAETASPSTTASSGSSGSSDDSGSSGSSSGTSDEVAEDVKDVC
jgi:LCP family protein required for cell wall assembly